MAKKPALLSSKKSAKTGDRVAQLDEYRAKRDFRVTPEPVRSAPNVSGNMFVVQMHDASRLHYDFRLEMGGVLKSWAVTRGPSLDPKVKRLAVRTEDHPVSYGAFEGTIPKGEYGGGSVIVWDTGAWVPMTDDPDADYARGDMKFRLDGKKMKGGWALVRIKGANATGKEWLLIKERDIYAQPEAKYVVIDDADLDQVETESTKTIGIEKFVDLADVDPMYLDSPYYIAPDGPVADETYRVLQMAMKERDKAALARVVMSGREHLVLLIPRDNGFVLNTLRTAAEVRSHAEYFAEIGDGKLDATAVKLANQLIEQFEGELDTSQFVDYYQEALTEVVKAKVKGTAPVIAKAPERGQVINLMDALKRSIDEGETKKPPAKSQPRKKAKTGVKAAPKAKKKKAVGAAG